MPKIIGFLNKSTNGLSLETQITYLTENKVEWENIYDDFKKLKKNFEPGDTLVFKNYSIISSKFSEVLEFIELIYEEDLTSLTEDGYDVTYKHVYLDSLVALCKRHEEFWANQKIQLRAHIGRKKTTSDNKVVKLCKDLYLNKNYTIIEISRTLKISRPSVYKYLSLKD